MTLAGTTLPARRLPREPSLQALSLGEVLAGTVRLDAAVEGPVGGKLEIRVSQPSALGSWFGRQVSGTSCKIGSATWQVCRLPLARSGRSAQLEVRIDGPPGARALVSSPLLRAAGAKGRPPVFVILLDTLRFDRLATYEAGFPLGARLDELARDGVVFERMYSSSSWTRTAVATLLTGLDARSHRVLGRTDVLRRSLDSLPQVLQRGGWRTMAFSTNPNILPMWGFDAGFDAFVDLGAFEWARKKTAAPTVLAAVRADLPADPETPAFYYVHLMDPHEPFVPTPMDLRAIDSDPRLAASFPGRERKAPALEEYRRYLGEIRGMDRELGAFFDHLRAKGLYESALILVVADHGEEFLDHDQLYHGRTLYEEVLRVPAILKLPGNALAGTRLRGEFGLADLAPTLLGVLGAGALEGADGRNLWDDETSGLRDESATQDALLELDTFQLAAVVQSSRKLIVDYKGGDQLFDLRADPREQHDLLPAAKADALELRTALDARLAGRAAGWHVRGCGVLDPSELGLELSSDGEVSGVDLEHADMLRRVDQRADGSTWAVDFRLTPRAVRREFLGSVKEEAAGDEDEVVVVPSVAADVRLRASRSPALRYARGVEVETQSGAEILLRPDDPATAVAPSALVRCWQPDGDDTAGKPGMLTAKREPYLRLWYVASVERRAESEVDPAVRERLRALGYAW